MIFPIGRWLKWDNIISEEHVDNHDQVVRIFRDMLDARKIRFLQIRDIDVTGQQSGRYGSLATLGEVQLEAQRDTPLAFKLILLLSHLPMEMEILLERLFQDFLGR